MTPQQHDGQVLEKPLLKGKGAEHENSLCVVSLRKPSDKVCKRLYVDGLTDGHILAAVGLRNDADAHDGHGDEAEGQPLKEQTVHNRWRVIAHVGLQLILDEAAHAGRGITHGGMTLHVGSCCTAAVLVLFQGTL